MPKRPSYRELCTTIESLLNRIKELELIASENQRLIKENIVLKERLSNYENPKNSRNSSIAPSQDENRPRPNQSLRKKSGRKPGGQLGGEGKTLEMTATPDILIELHPHYCSSCGLSLQVIKGIKDQSRQLVDVPPIQAIFTEYQTFSKICSCGCQTIADFPKGVNSAVGYGEHIEGLIGYFHARQYLPFARMKEMFNDVFNIHISEGGIHYLLNRFADKVTPIYQLIKQRISNSSVIGADETGVKVNGKKQWFWTWQNSNLTFITHSENRKQETIKKHFPKGFPNSTLIHDGWKPQLNTPAKNHQACLAHLQRRLNYLNQKYSSTFWGKKFSKLLYDAMKLKKEHPKNTEYTPQKIEIIHRLNCLLTNPPDKNHKELYSFYKRMGRERQHLFTFLFCEKVPSDNNASERAIRNVKVKQKISGQFKKQQTAQNFAKIRSVIDTTLKNSMNVLNSLTLIAKY